MQINISIKGVSNQKKKIQNIIYEYPDKEYTLKEFLAETVRINLAEFYAKKRENDVLKCLTDTEIKDMASEGKVSFQILYNDKVVSEEAAIENALQCFEDGMVAVFVDSTRIEELDCKGFFLWMMIPKQQRLCQRFCYSHRIIK